MLLRYSLLCITVFISLNAISQNQVLNGSFTATNTNWSFFAPGTVTEASYSEPTYGGTDNTNKVCEIDAQSYARQTITVVPGVDYSFSFRYSRRTGNGAAPNPTTINAKIYNATNTYINQDIVANNDTWGWTCFTGTFTPTENSVTIDFSYAMAGSATLGAVIDDVTVTPTLEQPIEDSGLTCLGGNLKLMAPEYPDNPDLKYADYSWTGPGGFTATGSSIYLNDLQLNQSGTYTVTMLLNNCLTVSGSYILDVNTITGTQTISVCTNQLPYTWNGQQLTIAGTYTDTTTTEQGCDSITTLTFNTNSGFNTSIDTSVCRSQLPFVWHNATISFIGNNIASYVLQSVTNGCDSTIHLNVIENVSNIHVELGKDLTICEGDSVFISADILPLGNYDYSWTPGGVYFPQNTPNIVYHGDTDIVLKLNVSTPDGCNGMDSVRIFVQPLLSTFANTNDTGLCLGSDSIQLNITGGVSYQWIPSEGLSNDTIANPKVYPLWPTDYRVIITGSSGCKDTQDIKINVYPQAAINLPDSVQIYPGESYQMNPEGNCLYFNWFPPSGLSSTILSNPIAQPEVRTRYFVTATTEYGCSVEDSIDVLVEGTVVDLPNVFTPGNGINNIFKPVYRGVVKLNSFTIYNRWGQQVFTSTDINKGWDGTFNDKPQPMGVYVYQIDVTTDSGKSFVKQGNITLIR